MAKEIGRGWLIVSGVMFAIYCANVLVGKISLLADVKPFFSLGDVGEFITLFLAVICLVVVMLERETKRYPENM